MTQGFRSAARRTRCLGLGCATVSLVCGCVVTPHHEQVSVHQEVVHNVSESDTVTVTVRRREELDFQPLNPARGDASPQAGVLWGDITEDVPSGVLLKFADGFSSPPHIHNITYRAVVISGHLHNDDPEAAKFWMGPGSYWSQPAGESHITAARAGSGATAFLEILSGPYRVQPVSQAFDNGERPINQEAKNRVWLDGSVTRWIDAAGVDQPSGARPGDQSAQFAPLWGDLFAGKPSGTLLRLTPGYRGWLTGDGSGLRSVVIQGEVTHDVKALSSPQALTPGSLFASTGPAVHHVQCGDDQCLIYVRSNGSYKLSARGR